MRLRNELKFEISRRSAVLLEHRLRAVMRLDPHAGEDGYFIRSLYFDDLDNRAYRTKLDGLDERSKLRIRCYDLDDRYIVLENKEKIGSLTRKSSQRIRKETALAMIGGGEIPPSEAQGPVMEDFRARRTACLLEPKVIVDYWRMPFVCDLSRTRVTLDTDLATAPFRRELFDETLLTVPVLDRGTAVLEVKFDQYLPEYIAQALADVPKTRLAVSKYVKCLGILE